MQLPARAILGGDVPGNVGDDGDRAGGGEDVDGGGVGGLLGESAVDVAAGARGENPGLRGGRQLRQQGGGLGRGELSGAVGAVRELDGHRNRVVRAAVDDEGGVVPVREQGAVGDLGPLALGDEDELFPPAALLAADQDPMPADLDGSAG
ncbi:hypothetical protein [Micromonospora profundi]|uniref:hypothetical protein n=1 Tax=Micromonospora profundi TaxID=1420889 RepID=UPI0036D17ED8